MLSLRALPPRSSLLSKAWWTAGMFGVSFGLKIASNVVLSRLLAPEIFGIMVIVNAVRMGVELMSDVGVEQNIVHSKDGLERDFFNTAWTIQILRGAALTLLFLALTPWLSGFYEVDSSIFAAISFAPLLTGLSSTATFALVKNLEVKKRNLFELSAETINFVICVTLALITPTVWALVIGALLAISARSALSYLLPHPPHRLRLDPDRVREIFHFGKWIMVSSLLMYASTNLDRLYMGRVAPFAVLGVFGIARTISDLPTTLARRLSYQIVFPFLADGIEVRRAEVVHELSSARLKFVAVAAIGIGGFAGWADWAVRIVYDPRYLAAGWMLFVLMIGAWFSILSNLNEALVLGAGKPSYSSYANIMRLVVLAAGLPLGFAYGGYAGILLAIVISEFSQYLYIAVGQHFVRLTFRRQDVLATMLLAGVITGSIAVRAALGLGVPWAGWNESAASE